MICSCSPEKTNPDLDNPVYYTGCCDASAGMALDNEHLGQLLNASE
jgi:hypothetical protein